MANEYDAGLITRDQASAWAGRDLNDDDMAHLDECVPNTSIPDVIADIVASWSDEDN